MRTPAPPPTAHPARPWWILYATAAWAAVTTAALDAIDLWTPVHSIFPSAIAWLAAVRATELSGCPWHPNGHHGCPG